ncbi:MAG: hypothetical protein WA637_01220 [Terriglobales bacterium]
MKRMRALLVLPGLALAISASAAILTTDPLTGLPLIPATENQAHPGNNDPVKMPDGPYCKSKMLANFYSVYESKMDSTVAWYEAHLRGFHKVANANGIKDIFYNDAGTLAVLVMGNKGNTDTYSVSYYRFEPGASAKAIVSMTQEKIVCQ